MRALTFGVTLAVAMVCAVTARAAYPERPVTILVGSAAGGGTDVEARILADRLTARLGHRVLVDDRPGAGGNIATIDTAQARPDGYTLTLIAPATVINQSLYVNPGYDTLRDLAPVAGWADAPLIFVVNPTLPVSSLKDLAAYSKSKPNQINYGNGLGFINQLVMELYKLDSGADIQFVPYPGMAPARTDVISGQIQATVDSIASSGPFVDSGQLKLLAVTSKQRLPRFPNAPTVAEAGYPDLARNTWYGVLAPARTPPDIVNKLASEIAAVQAEKPTADKIVGTGAQPWIVGPADFRTFLADEIETWRKVIDATHMQKIK